MCHCTKPAPRLLRTEPTCDGRLIHVYSDGSRVTRYVVRNSVY